MNIIVPTNTNILQNDPRYLIPYIEYQHNEIRYGFVDHNGKIIIRAQYDKIFDDFTSKDSLVRVGKRFIIDYGTKQKPRQYSYFHCGVIDSTGKELIPCNQYWELYFSGIQNILIAHGNRQKEECALINIDGTQIIPYGIYSNINPFHLGYARVQKFVHTESGREEFNGIIDTKGEEIIPLNYHFLFPTNWYENKTLLKIVKSDKHDDSFNSNEDSDDEWDYFTIDDCYDYEGNFDYDRLEDAILDGEYVIDD